MLRHIRSGFAWWARAFVKPSTASPHPANLAFVVVLVAVFTASFLIGQYALVHFPVSGDEYSYVLQGEIFASGKLAAIAPAHADLLHVDHVLIDALVRSKYPPGWPAWLALGWLVHAPWLVNPVLGCAALGILFLTARRLYGPAAALVSALLVGSSAFFLLNAASYHSHPSALFAAALFLWGFARAGELEGGGRFRAAVVAGMGLGLLAITRPGDTFALAVAALFFARRPKLLAGMAIGAGPFALVLVAYQARQFGCALCSGYDAYTPEFVRIYGTSSVDVLALRFAVDPHAHAAHIEWFTRLAGQLLTPFTLTLAAVGAVLCPHLDRARLTVHRGIVAALGAGLVVVVFTRADAGHEYGPRYLFALLGPGTLLVAAGYARVQSLLEDHPAWNPTSALPAWLVGLAVSIGTLRALPTMSDYHHLAMDRSALERGITALGLDNAAVIVDSLDAPTRYTRNGPRFDGPVLYVDRRGLSNDQIAAALPEREVFVAEQKRDGKSWQVRKVGP